MYFHFTKMHCLGKDVMVVDCITQNIFFSPELIRRLAHRQSGVGFEQLLIIEAPYDPDVDFHYRTFNAQGDEIEQAVDSLACLIQFARQKGLTNKYQILVSSQKGKFGLQLEENDQVRVQLGLPEFEPSKVPFRAKQAEKTYLLRVQQQTLFCGVVNVVGAYLITFVDDLNSVDLPQLATELSQHERFPQAVNVGFVQLINPNHIALRVFNAQQEEQAASVSGAGAAVAVGVAQGVTHGQVKVSFGEADLEVSSQRNGASLSVVSTAVSIYDGHLSC